MSDLSESLTSEQRALIVRSIERELTRQKMTRSELSARTKLSISSIDKALAKAPRFSDKTIFRIEDALGKQFLNLPGIYLPDRVTREDSAAGAPEALGGYSLKTAKNYIGEYICARPVFENPKNVYAYEMSISWNDADACLVFQEKKRQDSGHTQSGSVYLPQGSPFLHLLTVAQGWVRHIIVSQPDPDGVMKGLIQTLYNPMGPWLTPISAPIILRKIPSGKTFQLGVLDEKKSDYKGHRDLLEKTFSGGFAKQVSI